MPEFIDAHAHVNFEAYSSDRDDVIKRALDNNVWMINVGTQQDTSASAVKLAENYDRGVYAIIGLHPVHTAKSYHDTAELGDGGKEFTSRGEIFDTNFYKELAQSEKVVAIGECGLDFYRADETTSTIQKRAFEAQLALAEELQKPVMLHIRAAYKEAYDILKAHPNIKGDVHFFAGTWEEAQLFLNLGFTLSFTGVITFARDYDEVIRNTPLDMILTETDCPYVTPVPHRGKRNEPLFVQEVTKKIAEIKDENFEEVKRAIMANTARLFDLRLSL